MGIVWWQTVYPGKLWMNENVLNISFLWIPSSASFRAADSIRVMVSSNFRGLPLFALTIGGNSSSFPILTLHLSSWDSLRFFAAFNLSSADNRSSSGSSATSSSCSFSTVMMPNRPISNQLILPSECWLAPLIKIWHRGYFRFNSTWIAFVLYPVSELNGTTAFSLSLPRLIGNERPWSALTLAYISDSSQSSSRQKDATSINTFLHYQIDAAVQRIFVQE